MVSGYVHQLRDITDKLVAQIPAVTTSRISTWS